MRNRVKQRSATVLPPKDIFVRGDPLYDDNPLIRHIDPIYEEPARVERAIAYLPPFPTDKERAKSLTYRLRKTGIIPRLHIPLNRDLEVAMMLGEQICEGYVDRSPNARYWEKHQTEVETFLEAFRTHRSSEHADRCLGLVGISGVGKSRTLSKAVGLIKQVIDHNRALSPNLPLKQVVWIKVECPHDRSPGSIAKKIIAAIGTAVGEDYLKIFGGGDIDDLIVTAGALVRNHLVGLIIIDEIQNSISRSKNPRTDIVDLLVELSNELKVPMLFVGTYKAISLLGREMRSGRKLLGPTWDRYLPDDEDWKELIRFLWKYQWNGTFTRLEPILEAKLYELAQGVPAFLIRLFHLAQRRAILKGGEERLTATLLQETFDANFAPVRPIIRALASGDQALIGRYEDLPREFSLEAMMAQEAEALRVEESFRLKATIRNASKKAGLQAKKRLTLEAALATPSQDGEGPSPTHVVVQKALKNGRDPLKALVAAGLVGRELLGTYNAPKLQKADS